MAIIPPYDLAGHVSEFQGGATANSGAPLLIVAAGTGDNTAVTGQTINTLTNRGQGMYFLVSAHAALADTETLSIAAEYQDSADGSTWNTAVALQATTVLLTGDTGGTNEYGVVAFSVDLREVDQYVRLNFTPNLSAGATDTASVHGVALMIGSAKLPV